MCNFLIYMVELTIPPVRRLTIVTGTPRVAPHACLVQKTSTSQPYGFPLSERIRRRRIHLCRQSSCHASSASTENSPSVAGAPKPLTTMVEVAMLSAFSGMAYTLFATVGLEKYVGYFLPLPVVLASVRSGPGAGIKTVGTTCALLLVLQGPLRAAAFLCTHGLFGCCLAWGWAKGLKWSALVPLGAAAKVLGTLGYIGLSSWTMREDLLRLIITNVCVLLDQIGAMVGLGLSSSSVVVSIMIMALLLFNSAGYVFMLQILYTIIMRSMGYGTPPVPGFIARAINK